MIVQEIICSLFKLGSACLSMPIDKLLIEYLLVPSVVLIIIIYLLSDWFLRESGVKIKGLLSIVFYIVIIYSGLYGVFAQFAYSYVVLFIIFMGFIFIVGRFIKREHIPMMRKTYESIKTSVAPKELEKEIERRLKDIKDLNRQIKEKKEIRQTLLNKIEEVRPNAELKVDLTGIESQITTLESKKSALRGEVDSLILQLPMYKREEWEKKLKEALEVKG